MANDDVCLTQDEVAGFVGKLDAFRSTLSADEAAVFTEIVRAAVASEAEVEGFASSLWNSFVVSAETTLLPAVLDQRFLDGAKRGNVNNGRHNDF